MRLWLNLVGGCLLAALIAMLGVWLSRDPGLIEVRWLGYEVTTSVAFVLIALPLLWGLLWLLDGLLRRFPQRIRQARAEKRRRELAEGIRAQIEGRHPAAKRLLLLASTLPEQRPLALAAAALAAESAEEPVLADELLGTLSQTEWAEVARIQGCRLQRARGQSVSALERAGDGSSSPAALLERSRALLECGRAAEALPGWAELLAARPSTKQRLAVLEQQLLASALGQASDRGALQNVWHSLSREQRENARNVELLLRRALTLGCAELALDPLQVVLARSPDEALYALYGQLPHEDLRAALKRVELWLAAQPNSVGLRLSMARLCRRLQLWGKARELLESLLAETPDAATYEELGEWASEQADLKLARTAFANALKRQRGETVAAFDLLQLRVLKSASTIEEAAANPLETRSAYGFPLPPGG